MSLFLKKINEAAQIFPRLPSVINGIKNKNRKNNIKNVLSGAKKVESALLWLRHHNLAYQYIIISNERLQCLLINGDLN